MRKGDIVLGAGEAWEIVSVIDDGRQGKIRLVAGNGISDRANEVPISLLQGRTLYRKVAIVDDIDVQLATDEVSRYVDVAALGYDVRKWVEAFIERYGENQPIPDRTTLVGWFSRMIDSGVEKAADIKAEQVEEKRQEKLRRDRLRKKKPAKPIKRKAKTTTVRRKK